MATKAQAVGPAVKQILDKLDRVKAASGGGWMARCPAHEDRTPSLKIDVGDDGCVLLKCFAGCSVEGICARLGIAERSLFNERPSTTIAATYDYRDERGALLYQVVRYEPKDFRQRRPNGKGGWVWNLRGTRRVLYNLAAVASAKDVLVVEGEKDCDRARELGFVATCNAGGAGKWQSEFSEYLRGKRVTIIPDNDAPGKTHAQQVAALLEGKAERVALLELPGLAPKGDLSDWIACGGTRDQLARLVASAPEWTAVDQPNAQGAVLRCMADIEPEEVHWLWQERIPLGKLTLLIGDPGLGKSLLTVDIAARLSRGIRFADGAPCERASTIFLSAEDDAGDTIRPRLDAAGADVLRVYVLDAVRVSRPDGSTAEKTFSLESDIGHLESALARLPDVRLIVVDPLSAYLGGTDSHSNAEMRGLLSPLTAMASRRGVAILGVTHLRKSPGQAVHRAIGSIASVAAARAAWAIAPDPADQQRRLFLPVKSNLSGPAAGMAYRVASAGATARLEWEVGPVTMSADDVLGENGAKDGGTLAGAREWLGDALADGPLATQELEARARNAGIAWRTLRRAADEIGVHRRKRGFGGGWEWACEGGHVDPVGQVGQVGQLRADEDGQTRRWPNAPKTWTSSDEVYKEKEHTHTQTHEDGQNLYVATFAHNGTPEDGQRREDGQRATLCGDYAKPIRCTTCGKILPSAVEHARHLDVCGRSDSPDGAGIVDGEFVFDDVTKPRKRRAAA